MGNGGSSILGLAFVFLIYGLVSAGSDFYKKVLNPKPRIIYLNNKEGINYLKKGKEIYLQKNDSTYILLEDYIIKEQERINKNIERNKKTIEKKLK